MWKLFCVAVLAAFGTSCARLVELDGNRDCGHGFFAGDDNQCLQWPSGTTIRYSFDSASIGQIGGLTNEVHAAFNAWGQRMSDIHFQFQGNVTGYGSSADGLNTVYVITQGWDRGNQSQAYTRVLASGDRLTEADIYLNLQDFQLSQNSESGKVHARSLLMHEIGHLLGLVHNESEFASLMYPNLAYAQVRVQFTSGDLSTLDFAYQLFN